MQLIGLILLMGLGFLLVLQMNSKEVEEVESQSEETVTSPVSGSQNPPDRSTTEDGESAENPSNNSQVEEPSKEKIKQVEESFQVIENGSLKVTISSKGGQISSVELKEYTDYLGNPLKITDQQSKFGFSIDTKSLGEYETDRADYRLSINKDSSEIRAEAIMPNNEGGGFTMIYRLPPTGYALQHNVIFTNGDELYATDHLRMDWKQVMLSQEKDIVEEQRRTWLLYKMADEDMDMVKDGKSEDIDESFEWLSAKQQFFNTTLRGVDGTSFSTGTLSLELPDSKNDIVKVANFENIQLDFNRSADEISYSFEWIFAPNDYSIMMGYGQEMERITRPKFWMLNGMFSFIMDRLLTPLFAWLEGMNLGYGLIILIMTILIKLALSPLTFKSYQSQAKMRVLKPEMDEIKEKYEGDQAKISQATMALYRRTGVNPMSGCLPMIVQMPFLLAMFYFFPSAIELRGESFLWANDLSTYDDLIQFPFSILGSSHLSLFTLLFSLSSLGTAWVNLKTQGNNMQAGMEFMKYLPFIFPVVMLFIFNSFPAGLTYYYFLSTTFTLIQQLVIKQFFVDEDKIRAQLAAKKAKPQKKGGFWDRLQEAQKKQMEEMEKKKKKGKKK